MSGGTGPLGPAGPAGMPVSKPFLSFVVLFIIANSEFSGNILETMSTQLEL